MGESSDRCYAVNRMKRKWLLFSVAAIVMGIAVGTLSLHHLNPQPRSSAAAAVAEALPSAITLSDMIRRAHVVGVSTPVPGYIDVFLVDVGEEVHAGQELARIGNAGLESDRAQATAAVAQAQARLDATKRAVASAQLEASRADDDAERLRAELLRASKTDDRQEFALKRARRRVLLMRAPLVNWKRRSINGPQRTKRFGRRPIAFRMHSRNETVPRKSWWTVANN